MEVWVFVAKIAWIFLTARELDLEKKFDFYAVTSFTLNCTYVQVVNYR